MDFKLESESDRSRLMGHIAGLNLEKPRKVSIVGQDRSAEQNKKLHALLADIAAQVEHAGMKWDVTIWKRLCTAAWLRERGASIQMIPAIDGKGVDVLYEPTSKLSMKKCAELIEWVTAFGAEHGVKWSATDHWNGRYDQ
jgi:hypothetical protein